MTVSTHAMRATLVEIPGRFSCQHCSAFCCEYRKFPNHTAEAFGAELRAVKCNASKGNANLNKSNIIHNVTISHSNRHLLLVQRIHKALHQFSMTSSWYNLCNSLFTDHPTIQCYEVWSTETIDKKTLISKCTSVLDLKFHGSDYKECNPLGCNTMNFTGLLSNYMLL
jgi:hypothetical protein